MDLFSREIISWTLNRTLEAFSVAQVVEKQRKRIFKVNSGKVSSNFDLISRNMEVVYIKLL